MLEVDGGMQSQQGQRELICSVEGNGTKSEREGEEGESKEFKLSQHAECSVNRKEGIDREKRGSDGVGEAGQRAERLWCVGVCVTGSMSAAVSMMVTL